MSDAKAKSKGFLQVVGILILALIVLKVFIPKPDIRKEIADLQKKAGPEFDSLNNKIEAENRFFDSLQYLISSGKWTAADNIINQLLNKQPRNDYYITLKGQIFDARSQYDSALYYYNYALMINPNSGAGVERANTFIKTKQYSKAIEDYRKAFEANYDFSYLLAKSFELNNQKDSALKYYKVYLEHYPDSLFQQLKRQGLYVHPPDSIKLKIENLEK